MRNSNIIELILFQAYADLKAESARGHLGVLWWIIEPILFMSVFYVVFSVMRQQKSANFVAFLLVGLVPWKWFASTIGSGARSISNGAGLMNQVYLPKYIFPCVVMLINFAKFLIVLLLLIAFLILYGIKPTSAWLFLPVIVMVQFILMMALSGFLASLVPFLPDLKQIIDNGLMLMFFLSGVMFDIHNAPEAIRGYLYLNPMITLIDCYRVSLIDGRFPVMLPLMTVFIFSCFGILIAKGIIDHFDRVYPKMILR